MCEIDEARFKRDAERLSFELPRHFRVARCAVDCPQGGAARSAAYLIESRLSGATPAITANTDSDGGGFTTGWLEDAPFNFGSPQLKDRHPMRMSSLVT